MMKFASLCLFSAIVLLCARNTSGSINSNQEALISCMKIRRQAPHLNLRCEDLLEHQEANASVGHVAVPLLFKKTNKNKSRASQLESTDIQELSPSDMQNTKKINKNDEQKLLKLINQLKKE